MTIKQFCAETGEKYQTIYRNVKKYRDNSLAGHRERDNDLAYKAG